MAKQKESEDTIEVKEVKAEVRRRKLLAEARARLVDFIEERRHFLIVCEGKKTEPVYFEYIQNMLPKDLLAIEIRGEGDNTVNVVKKAIVLREERKRSTSPDYDEVWAVYDKDDFPASRYNEAVRLSEEKGIKSAHSNQSFELWYVLHFRDLQAGVGRKDYIRILSKEILKDKYKKTNPDIPEFMFTQGKVKQAIKLAKALDENWKEKRKTPADSCPHTRVYMLVEKLLEYAGPTWETRKKSSK
jgi:hypothetical protein